MIEYWIEAVSESLESAGLDATKNQINEIAKDIKISVDCMGLATGDEFIPNPINTEIEQLKKELQDEKNRAERELSLVVKRYARRRGVEEGDIYINREGDFCRM